jgi:RecB family exonuclease
VVKIRKKILSPTAINTYMACPQKYYLRYIKKQKSRASIHLIRGQLVHKTIQKFHNHHISSQAGESPEQIRTELLNLFDSGWQAAATSLNNLGLTTEQLKFYHEDSQMMLQNFSHWFYSHNRPIPDLSEARILSDNLGLLGIIDAVFENTDKVILIDYKTSKYAKITDDIVRQAILYSLLYQDRFNRVPDEVGIHFLKQPGDPKTIQINDNLLEYGKNLIRFIREKTVSDAQDQYPCTCGGTCKRDFVT